MSEVKKVRAGMEPKKLIIGAVALVVALLLPHYGVTDNNGVLPLFTVVLCAVYALFSLGLNIVVGFAGLLDLGYVAFFLVGAYVSAWFMSDFISTQNIHILDTARAVIPGIHLSFWFVVIVAGIIAALVGVVIGAPTLRLKSDYLALVTLGFGEILPEVFRNAEKFTNGTKGIGPVDAVGMGPWRYCPASTRPLRQATTSRSTTSFWSSARCSSGSRSNCATVASGERGWPFEKTNWLPASWAFRS